MKKHRKTQRSKRAREFAKQARAVGLPESVAHPTHISTKIIMGRKLNKFEPIRVRTAEEIWRKIKLEGRKTHELRGNKGITKHFSK